MSNPPPHPETSLLKTIKQRAGNKRGDTLSCEKVEKSPEENIPMFLPLALFDKEFNRDEPKELKEHIRAKSRFYVWTNGRYEWRDCVVIKSVGRLMFLIQWNHDKNFKVVSRSNLLFESENR